MVSVRRQTQGWCNCGPFRSRLVIVSLKLVWAVHSVLYVCSGKRASCEPRCWLLRCTDPDQHPSEQLASRGTGPTVLTATACIVTAHYTPIRWSERSNICLLGPGGDTQFAEVILAKNNRKLSSVTQRMMGKDKDLSIKF